MAEAHQTLQERRRRAGSPGRFLGGRRPGAAFPLARREALGEQVGVVGSKRAEIGPSKGYVNSARESAPSASCIWMSQWLNENL